MNLSNTCRIFADLQPALPFHPRIGTRLFGLSVLLSNSSGNMMRRGTTAGGARSPHGYSSTKFFNYLPVFLRRSEASVGRSFCLFSNRVLEEDAVFLEQVPQGAI